MRLLRDDATHRKGVGTAKIVPAELGLLLFHLQLFIIYGTRGLINTQIIFLLPHRVTIALVGSSSVARIVCTCVCLLHSTTTKQTGEETTTTTTIALTTTRGLPL